MFTTVNVLSQCLIKSTNTIIRHRTLWGLPGRYCFVDKVLLLSAHLLFQILIHGFEYTCDSERIMLGFGVLIDNVTHPQ